MASDSQAGPLSGFPHELDVQTCSDSPRQSINSLSAFYPIISALALNLHIPVNGTIAPAQELSLVSSPSPVYLQSTVCLLVLAS